MKRIVLPLLLIFIPLFSTAEEHGGTFLFSHTPGSYPRDIYLELTGEGPDGRELYYYFEESLNQTPVEYSVPLHLSALQGETRTYSLVVFEKEDWENRKRAVFIIDREKPPPPKVSVEPGIFSDEIALTYRSGSGGDVYYSVKTEDYAEYNKWDGTPVLLQGKDGYIMTYTVGVYAVDEAGNRGPTAEYTYVINKSTRFPGHYLDISSPAAGTFQNTQLLACVHEGFSWIRYTVNGDNPVTDGTEYTTPVMIRKRGKVVLRIAGYVPDTKEIVEKKIEYMVAEEARPLLSVESGVITETVRIEFVGGPGFRYTMNDTPPGIYDETAFSSLTLEPPRNMRRPVVLRFADPASEAGDYRYTYVLDGWKPAAPRCFAFQQENRREYKVAFAAERGTAVYYTRGGEEPDTGSIRYAGPFAVEAPGPGESPSAVIKAVAVSRTGGRSETAELRLEFSRDLPPAPSGKVENNNRVIIEKPAPGAVIYEKSSDPLSLPVPGAASPEIDGDILFTLPYGMEQKTYLQLALRDKHGNVSGPSEIFELSVDNQPPAKPVIKFLDGIVKITPQSGSTAYFTLVREVDGTAEVRNRDELYEKPFFVFGSEGKKTEYELSAYAVDGAGNNSGETDAMRFSVDTREPAPLTVSGVEDGGIYNEAVTIRFSSMYADQKVLYTAETDAGEGTELQVDTASEAAGEGVIVFSGEEDTVHTYTVAYAPYLEDNGSIGETRQLSFTIDMQLPQAPRVRGIEHEAEYVNGVTITHSNPEEGETVYYSISTGGTAPPDCFGREGRKFVSPLHLQGEKDKKITYSLLFGSVDEAGNTTYSEELYVFTIDREAPKAPAARVEYPDENMSRAEVSVEAGEEISVFYEIAEGNILPAIPHEESSLFDPGSPLILSGRDGEDVTYNIRLISVDAAGNRSREVPVFSVRIDKKDPGAGGEPVYISYKSGAVDISWDHLRGVDIFYAFNGEDWKKYESPLTISGGSAQTISYYFKDRAGNTSKTASIEVPAYRISADIDSFLAGAENGGRYNGPVTVYTESGNFLCRYETAFAEEHLRDISQFSPIMDGKKQFDVLPGETAHFFLAAQLFDRGTNLPVSEQEKLHFTIDTTKPSVPAFDITGGTYFQDTITIPISAEEGAIVYSVTKFDALGKPLEIIEDIRYSTPVTLDVPKGEYSSFALSAYSVDEVGNKSRVVTLDDLIIDKKIIYVSRLGNDGYGGSRSRPFKTLGKAVAYAKETDRNIMYVSGGQFPIDDTLTFNEDLFLQGGYDPFTWKQDGPEETVISAGAYMPENGILLSISAGTIHLKSLTLVTDKRDPVVLHISGGELSASAVTLMNLHTDSMPLFLQEGGKAELLNTKCTSYSGSAPEIIKNVSGELLLKNTTVENKGKHGGSLKVLRVENSKKVRIENSVLLAGSAAVSTVLSAKDTSVECIASTFSTGTANSRSFGIEAAGSELYVEKSTITASSSSRINTLIAASADSAVMLKNSTLHITGGTGGIGIQAADSTLDMYNCLVTGEKGNEFLYPFQLKHTKFLVQNNYITISTAGDFIGFDVTGGTGRLFNNTVLFASSSPNSYALRGREPALFYAVNNIIMNTSEKNDGPCIALGGVKETRIIANNLHGWKTALQVSGTEYAGVMDLNNADGNARGGDYHKNISESFTNSFLITKTEAPYYLKQSSRCVNGGVNVEEMGGLPVDFEGDVRPNPEEGLKPEYDIGADEF